MESESLRDWTDRLLAANGLNLIDVTDAIEREFGPANSQDVPALIAMLNHPDARVRYGGALALGAIGPGAEASVPHVLRLLRDPDAQVRHDAATALKRIDAKRPDVIRALFRLLLDDDDDTQAAAEEALEQLLRQYDGPDAVKFQQRFQSWCD